MILYIQSIFIIIFVYINWQIIYSDYHKRIIPNKRLFQLLWVLPFWLYFVTWLWDGSYTSIWIQFSLSIIITFLLYFFQIWWAGDAKYLLVLSFFLPSYNIIAFVGNIAIITLWILGIYFIYFYAVKSHRSSSIKEHIRETFTLKKWWLLKNYGNKVLVFLTIFTCIRVWREYFLKYIADQQEAWKKLQVLEQIYELLGPSYLIVLSIGLTIGILILWNIWLQYIIRILWKYNYNVEKCKLILLYSSTIALASFIAYELYMQPKEVGKMLFIIFTLYLAIVIVVKLIRVLLEISFSWWEKYLVSTNSLKPWTTIDHKHMYSVLQYKKKLVDQFNYDLKTKILDQESISKLQKIIKYVNISVKKNKKDEDTIENVMVIKTTPYGVYIFLGFIVTFFLHDLIMGAIVSIWIKAMMY